MAECVCVCTQYIKLVSVLVGQLESCMFSGTMIAHCLCEVSNCSSLSSVEDEINDSDSEPKCKKW